MLASDYRYSYEILEAECEVEVKADNLGYVLLTEKDLRDFLAEIESVKTIEG